MRKTPLEIHSQKQCPTIRTGFCPRIPNLISQSSPIKIPIRPKNRKSPDFDCLPNSKQLTSITTSDPSAFCLRIFAFLSSSPALNATSKVTCPLLGGPAFSFKPALFGLIFRGLLSASEYVFA